MPYVRDSFWRGREFASLGADAGRGRRWSADDAGQRARRPLEGATPAACSTPSSGEALRPLLAGPFVLASWATARIGPDIHAKVEKVLYSVPWRHIGKTADVRIPGPEGRRRQVALGRGRRMSANPHVRSARVRRRESMSMS